MKLNQECIEEYNRRIHKVQDYMPMAKDRITLIKEYIEKASLIKE